MPNANPIIPYLISMIACAVENRNQVGRLPGEWLRFAWIALQRPIDFDANQATSAVDTGARWLQSLISIA